jgi:pilus assembly protein Flp/PilA
MFYCVSSGARSWYVVPLVSAKGFGPVEIEELLMKSLALKVRSFLVSEDGPTAVEYAVMLALIVVVCLTAITAIGTKANTVFTKVGSSLGATGS